MKMFGKTATQFVVGVLMIVLLSTISHASQRIKLYNAQKKVWLEIGHNDTAMWGSKVSNQPLEFIPVPGKKDYFNIMANNRAYIMFRSGDHVGYNKQTSSKNDNLYQWKVFYSRDRRAIKIVNASANSHYLVTDHNNKVRVFTWAQLQEWGNTGSILWWHVYNINRQSVALSWEAKRLPRATGRWVSFCEGGVQCSKTISATITDGKSKSDTRSNTDTKSLSASLSTGIWTPGGSGGAEVTAGTESSVSQAKEIASSREKAETMTQQIDIDFATYDVRKVWRWVVDQPMADGGLTRISTTIITCTPDMSYPTYIPGRQPRKNPCLKSR